MSLNFRPITTRSHALHLEYLCPVPCMTVLQEVYPVLDPQRHIYFRIFVRLQITGILCSFLSLCFASSVPLLKAFTYKVATIASRFNVFSKNTTETGVAAAGKPAAASVFQPSGVMTVVRDFLCPAVGSFSLPFLRSAVIQCSRNHPSEWNTNCSSYALTFLRCAGTDSSTASA